MTRRDWPKGLKFKTYRGKAGVKTYVTHRATGRKICELVGEKPERPPKAFWHAWDALRERAQEAGEPKTLAAVARAYELSPRFAALRPATQDTYRWQLKPLVRDMGHLVITRFDDPAIVPELHDYHERLSNTPATADLRMAVLGVLLSYARARGQISANPVSTIRRIHKADRSEIVWTEDELARLRAQAPDWLRDAFDLALHTGLRQADVIALTWGAVGADVIEWRASKTQTTVWIPILPDLRAVLDRIPRAHALVATRQGAPIRKSTLQYAFTRARERAGVVNRRWHDLRGTAATRLISAGLTDREISIVMGWAERSVARIRRSYVADRVIAERMIVRLADRRGKTGEKRRNRP